MLTNQTDYIDLSNFPYKQNNKIDWNKVIGKELKFGYRGNIRNVLVLRYIKSNCNKIEFKYLDNEEIDSRSISAFYRGTSEYNNLPKYLEYDWELASKLRIRLPFSLKELKGEIEIVNVEGNVCTILYKNESYNIPCSSIINLKFYKQLSGSKKYKYNVNDKIELTTGEVIILEQLEVPNGKFKQKGYKYKCLICGAESVDSETHIVKRVGCSVCSNHKIVKGVNDFASSYPYLAEFLVDKEIGYKIGVHYIHKLKWQCPTCNTEFNMSPQNVIKFGLNCPVCSINRSIPERIMYSFLNYLGIKFEYQKMFNWSKFAVNEQNEALSGRKYYDFYIPKHKMIIETHGAQHYRKRETFHRAFELEKQNDTFKRCLALKNGIKYYFEIDCRRSEFDYIKNSIIHSGLSSIIDLDNINWKMVFESSQKTITSEIVEDYSKGLKLNEISKKHNVSIQEVRTCLKNASSAGFCTYLEDVEESKNKKQKIISLYNSGISIEEIVLITNTMRDTVVNYIREASRKGKADYSFSRDIQAINKGKVALLYLENKSIVEIAKELGIAKSTVSTYIKSLVKDGVLQSKEEKSMLLYKKIIKLHSDGNSIRKISKMLAISEKRISEVLNDARIKGVYYYEDNEERDIRLKKEAEKLKGEGMSIRQIASRLGSSHKKITALLNNK